MWLGAAEDPCNVLVYRGSGIVVQRIEGSPTERFAHDRADDGIVAEPAQRQSVVAIARRAPIVAPLNDPGARHASFMGLRTCLRFPDNDVDSSFADAAD